MGGDREEAREGRLGARRAEAGARASPGCQALRRRTRSQHCSQESGGAGFLSPLLGLVRARARALTHTHKPQTHRTHTRTLIHPGGRAGLLGRHLPVGGLQTSRESQKLHGLQTLESLAGPGPLLPPPTRPPLLGAGPGTHPRAKRTSRPRGEIRGHGECLESLRPSTRGQAAQCAQPSSISPSRGGPGRPPRRAGFRARPSRGWGGGSCKSPATRGRPPRPPPGKAALGCPISPGRS